MRYRLVIFDLDGTLADSFPWFCRVLNDVADRYRFKRVAPHEIDALRTMDARALMRHFGIPAWKMPFIANHMRKRKSRELDQTGLFAGVDRMLRELSDAGIALALVSSNSEANCRAILGADNASLIRHYECGAALFGKSSIRIAKLYLSLLESLGARFTGGAYTYVRCSTSVASVAK